MNIFELFGTIAIDNSKANKSISDTGTRVSKLSKNMKAAFTKVGDFAVSCGKVVAGGLAIGTTAFAGLVGKSLNLVGELEQNMGGSEAVFGAYAEGMQKTAAAAYKNMGLSQAEYLATANKMGALFQGVGYEVDESAELTTKAMQRAADVASIMGIDTAWAMESIAGAAKGNFSMLDNLGVAINDTTLANYALEKGIKKSTSKMTTQEKVMLAMQMFMEETAYATGNYAKENDTLAGSISTAKAAFTNFLAGSGTVDDFVESFENATRVVLRNLGEIVPRLGKSIWQAGKKMLPKLTATMRDTWNNKLPALATNGANKIIDAANAVFGVNIPHIDNIDFPTWEEMSTSVATWWTSVKDNIKSACAWTLKLFDAPNEAATEAGEAIKTWWTETALPGILSVSKWTLGLFDVPIEDEATVKAHVDAWWNTVGTWVAGACNWTLRLFGMPEDDATTISNTALTWWNTAKDAVIGACKWSIKFTGLAAWTEEDTEAVRNWWSGENGILSKLDDLIEWVLNPPTMPDPTETIKKITDWWESIKSQLQLTFAVRMYTEYSGKVQEVSREQGEIVENATGSALLGDLAETNADTFTKNPDSFVDYGAIYKWFVDGSNANGLDYVPFDGYISELHEGEAVLTRREASAWRSGSDTSRIESLLQEVVSYIREVASNTSTGQSIVLDSGALVGQLAPGINRQMGRMTSRNVRSVFG